MRTYKTPLTKRHFEIVAASVRETTMPADVRRQLAEQLAARLCTTNPRFNKQRFVTACGCN